jgi:hypothetical protein
MKHSGQGLEFAFHRSVAPMIWAIFAIAVVELGVVHFVVSLWNSGLAAILSFASLAVAGWILVGIRSFRRLPVFLEGQTLRLRAGIFKHADVELTNIANMAIKWEDGAIKQRAVLNLALIAWPNILITLKTPVCSAPRLLSRPVTGIAHKLDDPAAFLTAIDARLAALKTGASLQG